MDLNSNKLLDASDEVIIVPKVSDLRTQDPEKYINKINELDTPGERLSCMLWSVFTLDTAELTHEASSIRVMALSGGLGGLVLGGILLSPDHHESYIRRHNASVFEGKYRANRHFWDSLITGVVSRGLKYGFRCALLTSTAGIIGFGSIAYRNQLYFPDWLISFTTLGSISRLWLGSRAMAVGGLLGAVAGSVGYGFARIVEIKSGQSVGQIRHIRHSLWLESREAKLRRLQRGAEERHHEILADDTPGGIVR